MKKICPAVVLLLFCCAAAAIAVLPMKVCATEPDPSSPSLSLTLNSAAFSPGDRMVLTLTTTPGSGDNLWNAYAALVLPDNSLYFLTSLPAFGLSTTPAPLYPLGQVGAGTSTLLDLTFPAGLPTGNWKWGAVLAKPDLSIISDISWAAFTVAEAHDTAFESPFGFHPASVGKPGYNNNGYGDAQNIGVTWTRQGVYAFWFLVQPDLSKPDYDFSRYDLQWSAVPESINIMANIVPQGNIDEGYCLPGSYLPVDTEKYSAFVRATVERYDGDGIDDMPGLKNPIKYWQVGNEPSVSIARDFAELQRITYIAIKEACPDCSVLIGGVAGMPPVDVYINSFDHQYRPILDALGGKYVDIIDFHWYGNATGDYKGAKEVYSHIKSVLQEDGFPDIPVWIAEMGTYSGDPVSVKQVGTGFPLQTERQQAGDYLKRFVYSLSFGVKKIFPAFGLMEGFKYDGGYFDFTGLIYDGWGPGDLGLGVKKLSYYSYKKMTEKLEGSDWNRVQTVMDADDLHLVRFEKETGPVWVAWDDREIACITAPCGRQITIPGVSGSKVLVTEAVPKHESGKEVTDYSTAFNTQTITVSNGTATFIVGKEPVFVEGLNAACTDQQLTQFEQSMIDALATASTDVDFTLMLESGDGRAFSYSAGTSTGTTSYESASTSKLVTAVVILSLVDRGYLTLDSRPQELISFWTPASGNPASAMTLRHLLSFTSGFHNEPLCMNAAISNMNTCVQNIYNLNINNNIVPGSEFYYASTHLQIAGLMAIRARGYATWSEVFDEFKTRTGLFDHSTYDLPSANNPRLAGGMHWTGEDYLAFLKALYSGQILSAGMRAELWANQRGAAAIAYSPLLAEMGEDWGYGLGNWIECKSRTFNCGAALQRNSSPGAYGAYPFIDFENAYFGILARQGAQGTFTNGIDLVRTVQDTARKWATRSCDN